jgi:hypothetical protein
MMTAKSECAMVREAIINPCIQQQQRVNEFIRAKLIIMGESERVLPREMRYKLPTRGVAQRHSSASLFLSFFFFVFFLLPATN